MGASVGHHQRKRLYAMSKRFQLLAGGVFPFAAELNEEGEVVDLEAGIEEINVGKEINKERREAHERSEQAKKERDEYRQALKDKRAGKEPPQKKPKLEKKSPQDKKKGNKEKSRERIEKFMKKKRSRQRRKKLERQRQNQERMQLQVMANPKNLKRLSMCLRSPSLRLMVNLPRMKPKW